MKRVFYILLATLVLAGCQKSGESVASSDLEAVSFRAGTLTRSETKTTWTVGDKVAIFTSVGELGDVGAIEGPSDTSVPFVYTVTDKAGTLVAEDNCYYVEDNMSYLAIYPYIEGYTYASYNNETGINFNNVDILLSSFSSLNEDGEVDLQFSHAYACLEFSFTSTPSEPYTLSVELVINDGELSEDRIILESNAGAAVSTFVAATEVPKDVKAYVYINGENKGYVNLANYDFYIYGEMNHWLSGMNYKLTIDLGNLEAI